MLLLPGQSIGVRAPSRGSAGRPAMPAEPAPRGNVAFLAVARQQDRDVLASCTHGAAVDLQGVKYMLHPDQMRQVEPGKHYSFTSGPQAWHLAADDGFIYVAITAPAYPVRHASAAAAGGAQT